MNNDESKLVAAIIVEQREANIANAKLNIARKQYEVYLEKAKTF